MKNTYAWVITSLDCIPSLNGQTNVVSNISWQVTAVSNQGKTTVTPNGETLFSPFIAVKNGSTKIETLNLSNFVNYADLTKDVVVDWVKSTLGEEEVLAMQSALDDEINELINPLKISLSIPWE
jgi:hypothetical protein